MSTDVWSASDYNTTAPFVYSAEYTSPILALLHARPGERIIDFGCGTGELTIQLAKAVTASGFVVGVDASEDMITTARANGLEHCFVSDIQELATSVLAETAGTFDAVFSNAVLHWCKRDPAGAIESARAALKMGGRFVGEMGGFSNVIGIRAALHTAMRHRGIDPSPCDPWFFPSVGEYRKLLESHGFFVQFISLEPRLTPLVGSLRAWLELFCRKTFLAEISDTVAASIWDEVEASTRVDCLDSAENWSIMYCRLRFVATKVL